jgi:hypothetical protein
MNKLLDILLKLGIITILIIAVITKQPYIYFVFVRGTVFTISIYFAFKLRHVGNVIFFCTFAILFNPFIQFGFSKEIWRLIDIIVSAIIALSIDWKGYRESLLPKGKLIYYLIKNCFWGVVASIAAFWFIFSIIDVNPFHEYLLITKGITTNGFIINSEEYEDEVDIPDSQGGGSEPVTVDNYKYTFITQDGEVINNWSSDLGYIKVFTGKPLPIQVEYLSNNPEINRVKDMTNQCNTIAEFL